MRYRLLFLRVVMLIASVHALALAQTATVSKDIGTVTFADRSVKPFVAVYSCAGFSCNIQKSDVNVLRVRYSENLDEAVNKHSKEAAFEGAQGANKS